ncbi:DUF5712 family protein [Sphingobacterium bovistauri]|uniref:Molybdopterin-guanine dinucleotide biosynthesis protein MobB n=1 Tax=Sphingobacterium bovistauri TaxID=2781959 RepID=A0ABS7Z643_9SPHI|nr:DUF5712 family protein [Sphingobacterium bovistauri]MCA5005653.1 molybdopterin-guanine dinucleotide biosynthesis protein MobB [Sphingobacterium bovistauri]
MYINITTSETGDNKGSCGALVAYLEKENKDKKRLEDHENWFNGKSTFIKPHEVRIGIDNNIAKLTKGDSKFFLININPSQKELHFLISQFGEEGVKDKLKEFAIKVMDEYAKNFKRDTIRNHKDLLWYGKLENYRYYGYNDKEVKNGTRQRGDRKEGQQLHVQIIVSRKDITNKIKLSPQNTSRGKNASHSAKLGQFDRTAFKQSGESLFDEMFGFNRGLKERMDYANIMKNGTIQQKAQLQVLNNVLEAHPQQKNNQIIDNIITNIPAGQHFYIDGMLSSIFNEGWEIFDMFLEPLGGISGGQDNIEENKNKKMRKKRGNQVKR